MIETTPTPNGSEDQEDQEHEIDLTDVGSLVGAVEDCEAKNVPLIRDALAVTAGNANSLAAAAQHEIRAIRTPDLFIKGRINSAQFPSLRDFAGSQKYGPSSGFLLCKGETCPIFARCPIHRAGEELPLEQDCPVELTIYSQWATDLFIQHQVDQEDIVDAGAVKELAMLYLYEWRIQQVLADKDILVESLKNVSFRGDHIYETKANPAFSVLSDITKRKQKILESLISTRAAKAATKGQVTDDLADKLQSLLTLAKTVTVEYNPDLKSFASQGIDPVTGKMSAASILSKAQNEDKLKLRLEEINKSALEMQLRNREEPDSHREPKPLDDLSLDLIKATNESDEEPGEPKPDESLSTTLVVAPVITPSVSLPDAFDELLGAHTKPV